MKEFLERLQAFGQEKGYFEFQLIKEPEDTCCPNAEIEVIDFDKTKEKIQLLDLQATGFNVTKSCDALKFITEEGRLDFIEYKRWQAFIDGNLSSIESRKVRQEEIIEKIQKFDLQSKIYDSVFLIDFLTRNKEFNMTKDEKNLLPVITINYIVLVDINAYEKPLDYIAATLTFLSSNIELDVVKAIKQQLDIVELRGRWNIQKPKLKDCESIVAFYS